MKSGLRLAAFLAAMRAFAEQSAPGVLRWEELAEGELRYVGITSDAAAPDAWLYYATSTSALIVSLTERAAPPRPSGTTGLARRLQNRALGRITLPQADQGW